MKTIGRHMRMLLLPLVFVACQQDDLPFYTGDKTLVILVGDTTFVYADHLPLEFVDVQVGVYVFLLGANGSEGQIPYKLRLNGDVKRMTVGSASESVSSFDSVYTVSGQPDTVSFRFVREKEWADTVCTLAIALETDAEYSKPIRGADYAQQVTVLLDDRLKKPDWWDTVFDSYFGVFSSRKIRTIFYWIDASHVAPHAVYEELGSILLDDLEGFSGAFRQYLESRAASGDPVLERNGEPVSVGEKASYP